MKEQFSDQDDEHNIKYSSSEERVGEAFIDYAETKFYEADKRSETAREEGERKERMHNRWLILAAVCYVLFTGISVPIMGNYCYWKSWWGSTTECRTEQQPCNR